MQTEDKKLVEEYLNGEEGAFSELLQKYLKSVFNFVFSFTKDVQVVEDLTQETFIKAWKNIRKFDREKNFKIWIFTIAKNTTFDFFKKKKTLSFSSFTDDEGNNKLENIASKDILPNEILEKEDLAQKMTEKLEQISEKYRAILILRYKEDFELKEIAEILDVPYNTVKAYHKRALFRLKEAFLSEK